MNISELRDLKLSIDEWSLLPGIAARHMTYEWKDEHIDMLVLSGLVERIDHVACLTEAGKEAARAIDMIFDWEVFAFGGPESPSESSEAPPMADPRKRMTVGALVRHDRTGGIGLIVEHSMFDGDHGGFRVNFVKPVAMSDLTTQTIITIFDRHDMFSFVP